MGADVSPGEKEKLEARETSNFRSLIKENNAENI